MRFGRYELGNRIATGGMAEVYAARYAGTKGFVKQLAVKRILPRFSADPGFVRLFIREARLASKLHHANIVQVHDFDQVEGIYYIAMDLVSGVDLRRLLDCHATADPGSAGRIPLEIGVYIAAECLAGLMAAHELCSSRGVPLGIVHRDVSPHNILVSYSGEVKLTDFGIAKAVQAGDETASGVIRGKLRYMSPEQAAGREIDQRSDLFSLGIVLWELATGRRLYGPQGDPASGAEAPAQIPDPATLSCAISPALRDVIQTLLRPDPGARYASAREALGALRSGAGATDRSLELGALMEWLFPRESAAARRSSISSAVASPPAGDTRSVRASPLAQARPAKRRERRHQRPKPPASRSPPDGDAGRGRELRITIMLVAIVILAGVLAYLAVGYLTAHR